MSTVTGAASPALLRGMVGGLSRRRLIAGLLGTVVGLPILTAILVPLRSHLPRESGLLIYILAVVILAVVGGVIPALLAAVAASLLASWFLTPPYGSLQVKGGGAALDIVVFLLAALVVSVAVEVGARERASVEQKRLEAELASRFASSEMSAAPVEHVLEEVRALFAMSGVALRAADGHTLAQVGEIPDEAPTLRLAAGAGRELVTFGPDLFAADRRLLTVLASSAGQAWERAELADEAARSRQLAETDRVRSALLAAVGHDLRTPIAGIKASASALREPRITLEPSETRELLDSIVDGADHLSALVDNLLALSRIQAGALSVHPRAIGLDEVVARALVSLHAHDVEIAVPEDLPPAWVDPGLLERAVANLVDNARRWNRPESAVTVRGRVVDDTSLAVDVIDHGQGVDQGEWETMFAPFHRLDESGDGVGLGLAIVRGLLEAMDATVAPAHTPKGGLTMTITVPRAR
ncbi:sensor histidine kinase [Kribbia dieselivorans]|uniref:sensor histidine kinase n=1 Tax=Kribbia dieselivorans TaxID=331526 RepID=UPI0008393E4A|nr:DUF4118 domain-containing protein [Kribbia dieselivorans]